MSDSVIPWTVAYQVPPTMGFSRQEYWSGLPFPSPDLPNPGIEPVSPASAGGFLTTRPPGKSPKIIFSSFRVEIGYVKVSGNFSFWKHPGMIKDALSILWHSYLNHSLLSSCCLSPILGWCIHILNLFQISWVCVHAKSLSCVRLCDPMDCSPPGSSVPGIPQAGILEWVAMPSSRGSSWPRDGTLVSYFSCIGRRVLYR